MVDIVVLGVFVADVTFRADRMPATGETILGHSFAIGPGGKGSNQAIAAARAGGKAALITRVGRDDFAEMAFKIWADAGVDTRAVTRSDTQTGAAGIMVNAQSGDNAIIITPGAAAEISCADVEAQAPLITNAKVFITQLEQPIAAARRALELARAAGVTTILNPAPAAPLDDDLLALCDIVTPNETEAQALTGVHVHDADSAEKACDVLMQKGVKIPVITMGGQGAYLQGHGMVPAVNAGAVVDTTGAGDAFNAGFAVALARRDELEKAMRFGAAVAGLSVTKQGAASSMPDAGTIAAVMGAN